MTDDLDSAIAKHNAILSAADEFVRLAFATAEKSPAADQVAYLEHMVAAHEHASEIIRARLTQPQRG